MRYSFPKVYPILDASIIPADGRSEFLHRLGAGLAFAGVTLLGTFGGSEAILPGVLAEPADYFSVGPVFSTRTKQTSKAPIGVEGVRRLRAQAGVGPILVGVGGITLATAAAVLAAGADVVAVSEALFGRADPAEEFRKWVDELG